MDTAIEFLGAEPFKGGRYIYRAEETGLDYIVTREDLEALSNALEAGVEDAYSLWCNQYGEELTSFRGWKQGMQIEIDGKIGTVLCVRRDGVYLAWGQEFPEWESMDALKSQVFHILG